MDEYLRVAKTIDHALLAPTLTLPELREGCRLACAYRVASVCIMPWAVELCREELRESDVKVSTVIGFPLGVNLTDVKVTEAQLAIDQGCEELDMVVNVSQVLSEQWGDVRNDVAAVLQVVRAENRKLKLIFENCYLEERHKIQLCELCNELGIDWAKTSTGFGTGGATTADLQLMRAHLHESVQLKASGGLRTLSDVQSALACGATRVGMSKTRVVLDELRQQLGLPAIADDFSVRDQAY